jgi:alpha-galactosidase
MIQINEQVFKLETKNSMYVFRVTKTKHLQHVYYGAKFEFENIEELIPNFDFEQGTSTSYSKDDKPFSLGNTLLEVSTFGKGDYREPSLHFNFEDGSTVSDFLFSSFKETEAKQKLDGLPSTYDSDQNLVISLVDQSRKLEIELEYNVFENEDVITRNIRVINNDKSPVVVDKAMSFNLDFADDNFEMITLNGSWIRERHITTRKLFGITKIDSKKGVSSSDHNPSFALKRPEATEHSGEVYGFSLVYSGNFEATVEVNSHQLTRVNMGINSFDFRWTLNQGQVFQTPEVVMTYSNQGLNKMSESFHQVISGKLVRGVWKSKERPILLNNWEATYFDFNQRKLMKLAKAASKIGIELFVLDDGWFGKRNDDTSSLGDYNVNKKKLPQGLHGLASKINKQGMMFGIWVEPEMVNEDSDLYRLHPDWAIKHPNYIPSLGRNQMNLDLANPAVCEYILSSLRTLFDSANIEYCKWDMNRNFSDVYSSYLTSEENQAYYHRYVLGLYSILERLNQEYPHILFESCASGGNRFDMGMLHYMPQVWTSDDTDAYERQKIQYGTSLFYPPSVMGCHVSSAPNHQTFRNTPIETRFNVAAFGLLGYELDLNNLTKMEEKTVKAQIEWYKKYRKTLQFGTFKRLESPFEQNKCKWLSIGDEVLVGDYQNLATPNPGYDKIQTKYIPEGEYNITNREQFIDVRTFGDHLNSQLPFKIKMNGIIHTMIANRYMFKLERENLKATSHQLNNFGFIPKQLFTGTGYNENVKLNEDFSSRIYIIAKADR